MPEQLTLDLPTFLGRTVGDVHLRLAGSITCATDQIPGAHTSGEVWLLCRARPDGVGIKLPEEGSDAGPTWTNQLRITEAYALPDTELARAMRDDLRESVEAAIDALAGRAKLPVAS